MGSDHTLSRASNSTCVGRGAHKKGDRHKLEVLTFSSPSKQAVWISPLLNPHNTVLGNEGCQSSTDTGETSINLFTILHDPVEKTRITPLSLPVARRSPPGENLSVVIVSVC